MNRRVQNQEVYIRKEMKQALSKDNKTLLNKKLYLHILQKHFLNNLYPLVLRLKDLLPITRL